MGGLPLTEKQSCPTVDTVSNKNIEQIIAPLSSRSGFIEPLEYFNLDNFLRTVCVRWDEPLARILIENSQKLNNRDRIRSKVQLQYTVAEEVSWLKGMTVRHISNIIVSYSDNPAKCSTAGYLISPAGRAGPGFRRRTGRKQRRASDWTDARRSSLWMRGFSKRLAQRKWSRSPPTDDDKTDAVTSETYRDVPYQKPTTFVKVPVLTNQYTFCIQCILDCLRPWQNGCKCNIFVR